MASTAQAPRFAAGGGASVWRSAGRLESLDNYRGLLVLALVAGGFGATNAGPHGFRLTEVVQPGFAFAAGVAVPLAIEARRHAGQSRIRRFAHWTWRAFALVLLGNLLFHFIAAPQGLQFQLVDPLSQIGLGCLVALILIQLPAFAQAAVALAMLFSRLLPAVGPLWVRETLLISLATATMVLFGCWTGRFLLRSRAAQSYKVKLLAAIGVGAVAEGLALRSLIPLNLQEWTASFLFFHAGLAILGFALLFSLEGRMARTCLRPLQVLGESALLAYCLSCALYLLWSAAPVSAAGRIAQTVAVVAAVWLVCYGLSRRGIRVKL
jgi:predicted acyltransferase